MVDLQSISDVKVDRLILQVSRLWHKRKRQVLDHYELTNSQFEILEALNYLSLLDQEIIQVNISDVSGIDPMTTSSILKNLEKRGVVERSRGVVNTRVIYVRITSFGEKLYTQAKKELVSITKSVYNNVDKKQLSTQLQKLVNELNQENNFEN